MASRARTDVMTMLWACLAGLGMMMGLSSCGGMSSSEQTLEALREGNATQLAHLQMTATVAGERLQITLEHMETRMARAKGEQVELLAMITERGIDTSRLPSVATLPPTAVPVDNAAPAVNIAQTPLPTATPVIEITPFNTTPTARPVPTFAASESIKLRDIVVAASVGVDDCAENTTNQFSPSSEHIYIVARAVDVSAAAVIGSVWKRDGVELTRFEFTPGFVIEDACIWFFADQTDFEFLPGEYSISLTLNGAPASSPVPFTIFADNSAKP